MQKVGFIEDSELGRIILCQSSRARRFTFRYTQEGFSCTAPARFRQSDLLRAIEELRPRLKAMKERSEEWHREHPRHLLMSEEVERLRQQAKLLFPQRLQALAAARGLRYHKLSIRKSRTRWGSCSSKGNISLSLYLMLVPTHLQDYVMQHELTHLVEMNHSPRFWELLDEATGGRALRYRRELKQFAFFILSFFIFNFSFLHFSLFCLPVKAEKVMWYNVENVFDTQHDTLKNDYDFLPQGTYRWTPWRYWRKLDNISRVIAAVAEQGGWPMLVGMCEVENDTVLRDLTLRSPLRAAKYRYVHSEGPDLRGVDCCLLYQPSLFHLLGSEAVRIPSAEHGLRPTRDILHVWGRFVRTDSLLHVFVLHFPSRAGGDKASTQNRMLAARTLCAVLDTLQGQRVLVMGDFNAEPKDPVFQPILQRLVSLMPQKRRELKKAQGTYYYQGLWGYIDHILVSPAMKDFCESRAHVAKFPFLLTEKGTPWRTFQGPVYKGGYSDHLPIYVQVK